MLSLRGLPVGTGAKGVTALMDHSVVNMVYIYTERKTGSGTRGVNVFLLRIYPALARERSIRRRRHGVGAAATLQRLVNGVIHSFCGRRMTAAHVAAAWEPFRPLCIIAPFR